MSPKSPFFSSLPKWVQWLGVGLAMAAVAVGLVFVFIHPGTPKAAASRQSEGPAIVSSPNPQPTLSQDEAIKKAGGIKDGDGSGSAQFDTTKESAFAIAAVKEWITWNSTESTASRAARLAPYFSPGSQYLTMKPVTANGPALAHSGAVTKTQIDSNGYAGLDDTTDSEFTFAVTYRYISTAVYGGYTYNYSGAATFNVVVPRGLPAGTKLASISQPTINF